MHDQSTQRSPHRRRVGRAILLACLVLGLAACASQPPPTDVGDPPGFLLGLLHGFIAPVTFIISLFENEIRIYAFPNAGAWYDLGFVLGSGILFGGGGSAAKRD